MIVQTDIVCYKVITQEGMVDAYKERGYIHSFMFCRDAIDDRGDYCTDKDRYKVGRFVIPKGTQYREVSYDRTPGYMSEKLRFEGVVC